MRISLMMLSWVLATFIVLILALITWASGARSEPLPVGCQTPSPCKIVILSLEEEQALVGANQILDTAMQGRPLDLTGKVLYFKDKLRTAPAGTAAQPQQENQK